MSACVLCPCPTLFPPCWAPVVLWRLLLPGTELSSTAQCLRPPFFVPTVVQCPAVGRKLVSDPAEEAASTAAATNGVAGLSLSGAGAGVPPADTGAPSAAQRLAASADKEKERNESVAEPYALEAKHYTEMRCLHREVCEELTLPLIRLRDCSATGFSIGSSWFGRVCLTGKECCARAQFTRDWGSKSSTTRMLC